MVQIWNKITKMKCILNLMSFINLFAFLNMQVHKKVFIVIKLLEPHDWGKSFGLIEDNLMSIQKSHN
jgi:hypothetical protein